MPGEGHRCLPVTSRSRSNIAATTRQASRSNASRAAARPSARAVDTVITFSDIKATTTSGGELANTLNCCAARTSADRAETAIPTQIAQPASSGVNSNCTRTCVPA